MTTELLGPPDLPGVRHGFVEVATGATPTGRLRMHWAEAGDRAAPTVVLLHGWPQHWLSWRHQIADLSTDHHVVAVDLRGHGWSDAPPGGYDKEQLASDVLALLDHPDGPLPGPREVDLVGHDWGGWTGFLLCLRQPWRLRTFTALSITHPFQRLAPRKLATLWRFWYQAAVSVPGVGAALARDGRLVAYLLEHWGTASTAWTREELASFVDRLGAPGREHVSGLMYRTFLTRELPAILAGRYADARLEVPTQLLVGTDDRPIARALLDGHDRNAPGLTVELVEGAGHFLPEERPDLVTSRIREHLARGR